MALCAIGIQEGDEVIIPSFTWVSTANVIEYCNAKPVICDVDPNTFNIEISKIKEKITEKTKAIIVVHLFGLCVDFDELRQTIPSHIKVIEDDIAAGAMYKNSFAGSLGDIRHLAFTHEKLLLLAKVE